MEETAAKKKYITKYDPVKSHIKVMKKYYNTQESQKKLVERIERYEGMRTELNKKIDDLKQFVRPELLSNSEVSEITE